VSEINIKAVYIISVQCIRSGVGKFAWSACLCCVWAVLDRRILLAIYV